MKIGVQVGATHATLLAALLATAAPSQAQDAPASLPTRDVDVTYRSEQAGKVLEQRSRFALGAQRMRLDTPTKGLYMIVDYRTHAMMVVSEADKGVLDMPAPPTALPGAAPPGAYVRRGQDQVAGLPCTEWEAKDSQGQPALTCFTADGVMLRARRGTAVLAVATRVVYGPLDPALFTAPPGYNHIAKRALP